MSNLPAPRSCELTREILATTIGMTAVGTITSRELLMQAFSALFINSDGAVELVTYQELLLDSNQDDNQVIAILLERGYTENQILSYLRGRDTRRKTING